MLSTSHAPDENRGAFLALGFGTTVAMWTVGYLCRLPAIMAPGWFLLLAMVICLVGGGIATVRFTSSSPKGGAVTGVIASLLNLLIMGGVLSGGEQGALLPSAAFWIPGSLLFGALLGTIGGTIGNRLPRREEPRWTAVLAFIGVAATFLLIVAGGLVTSSDSGLAVVDWPNSFGYNMFLYPLSQMSGGIYYEHAHRLLGSLVGLTTIMLSIQIWMREKNRKGLKLFTLLAIVCVIVQGILGGLRVTGQPTLSTSPADMSPSVGLAAIHGVFGQLFLGIMVSIALMTSRKWLSTQAPAALPSVSTDRKLSILLGIIVVGQLVLGAVVRHLTWGLMAHIGIAVLVLLFAVVSGMRATGYYSEIPKLRKLGHAIVGIVSVQVLLGVIALFATGITPEPGPPSTANIIFTTLHQVFGAFLLAHVAMLICWLHRLVIQGGETASLISEGGLRKIRV